MSLDRLSGAGSSRKARTSSGVGNRPIASSEARRRKVASPHGGDGVSGLGDGDGSVDDLDARGNRPDLVRRSEEQHADTLLRGLRGSGSNLSGPQISPARIHSDRDHGRLGYSTSSPAGTTTVRPR